MKTGRGTVCTKDGQCNQGNSCWAWALGEMTLEVGKSQAVEGHEATVECLSFVLKFLGIFQEFSSKG